jgi:diacylglycerol kinase (ATP)
MVVVAGGDGLINEAVNALAFTNIPLGIIPRGTGNAFAKDKKIPFSLEKAIDVLKPDNLKEIDLGLVNGKRYFLMMCSCGFDVKAISDLNPALKKKFKILAYVYHGVKAFFTYKPVKLTIKISGENVLCKGYFFIASNVRSYGFPMAQIAPEASIDDGLLDICVFMNKGKISFIANILAIFLKTHINFKNVFYIKTSEELIVEQGSSDVVKKSRHNTPMVQLDGDIYQSLPVTIRIEKKALNIFLP